MIDGDETIEMAVEIGLGKVDPPSWYNKEQRDTWKRLFRQIQEIKGKGGTVDIPMETP